MMDINKYIVNGTVKRDRIVADVKRGRLSIEDINQLDNNEMIRSAYFGNSIFIKNKSEWDEKYLDELSLAAVSEVFNKSYLVNLYEVVNHVISKKRKKDKIMGMFIGIFTVTVIVIVVGAIVTFVVKQMN